MTWKKSVLIGIYMIPVQVYGTSQKHSPDEKDLNQHLEMLELGMSQGYKNYYLDLYRQKTKCKLNYIIET